MKNRFIVLILMIVGMTTNSNAKQVTLWGTSVDTQIVKDRNFTRLSDTRIYNGDTTIEGDLILDVNHSKDHNDADYYDGVAVAGNLTVTGNIIGLEDEGSYLYVSGNLRAKNILTSGYRFLVDGNITVDEIMIESEHYNTLRTNYLKAKVFISENMDIQTNYGAIDAIEIDDGTSVRSISSLRKEIPSLSSNNDDEETIQEIVDLVTSEKNETILSDILEVTGDGSNHLELYKKGPNLPRDLLSFIKKYAKKIKINDNDLNKSSVTLSDITHITMLDLRKNDLEKIPSYLSRLVSLKELYLNDNELTRFPEVALKLTNLKILNLSRNSLRVIPKDIVKLKNLEKLIVYKTNLLAIPKEIGQLSRLEQLNIGYTYVKELPDELFDLPRLKQLWLYNCNIDNEKLLNAPFAKLNSLEEIDIGSLALKKLPDQLYELHNLKILEISDNSHDLKKSLRLENFPNLESLDLYGLNLRRVPSVISTMNKLKVLKIGKNRLFDLGDIDFPPLEELYLQNNYLDAIPDNIARITTLKKLSMSNNEMDEIGSSLGMLSNLKYLNVSSNTLRDKSFAFGSLLNLEELKMSNCKLKKIPEEILSLTSLQKLNLNDNKIKTIPKEIARLTKLTYLDLSENSIETLPGELSRLESLVELDIDDNSLEKPYDGLKELPWKMQKIYLANRGERPKFEIIYKNCTPELNYECSSIVDDYYYEDNETSANKLGEKVCANGYGGACRHMGSRNDDDINISIRYYKKGCDLDDEDSCHELGVLYSDEKHDVMDINKSIHYHNKACENTQQESCTYLAQVYRGGELIKRDYARAKKIYYDMEIDDEPAGYIGLGSMYLYGEGVSKDSAKALEYYKRACWAKGNSICKHISTVIYAIMILFVIVIVFVIFIFFRYIFRKK